LSSQKFMYPSLLDQLQTILNRQENMDVFWHHLKQSPVTELLRDIYDGSVWKEWKTKINPATNQPWFCTEHRFEVAVALNMYVCYYLCKKLVCYLIHMHI